MLLLVFLPFALSLAAAGQILRAKSYSSERSTSGTMVLSAGSTVLLAIASVALVIAVMALLL